MSVSNINECVCCGSKHLVEVIDLGEHPLANTYTDEPTELAKYPLKVMACKMCDHLQLSASVEPDLMFKDYSYVSGTTQTLRDYFKFFAYWATEKYKHLNGYKVPTSVLDIACNDGSMLNEFKSLGLSTFGVDPAENLLELSSKNSTVQCSYFDKDSFKGRHFDIITAQNVIAHTTGVIEFLRNCERLLLDGVLFLQTSQANIIENNEYDYWYSEHISQFTKKSMEAACSRVGLEVVGYEKFNIHGVSQVFIIKKKIKPNYQKYKYNIEFNKERLNYNIGLYKREGFKLVGYGSAAKGMTLLGYTGVRPDYIIDDNPLKIGKYCPLGIPVVSVDKLKEEKGKILFIPLAWNFFEEIKNRIKKVRDNKEDLFIKYFPEINICH